MELNDIRIFLELYKNLSITKTADKLGYTQSNISTRLAKLEEEFQTNFFKRTRSGLELLPSANRFYPYAKEIEINLDKLYDEFCTNTSIIEVGATQLLSHLYHEFFLTNNHQFKLYTSNVEKLQSEFHQNIYDVIITHTKLEPGPYYELKTAEPLAWAQSIHFQGNKDYRIVINRDKHCPLRKHTLEVIKEYQLEKEIIEVDTLDLMLQTLSYINSIALLPQKILKGDIIITNPTFSTPISLDVYTYIHNKKHQKLFTELSINP